MMEVTSFRQVTGSGQIDAPQSSVGLPQIHRQTTPSGISTQF